LVNLDFDPVNQPTNQPTAHLNQVKIKGAGWKKSSSSTPLDPDLRKACSGLTGALASKARLTDALAHAHALLWSSTNLEIQR
jgi:hypothetical protein